MSVDKPLSNSIQCQCGSLLMIYLKLQKVQEILMVSYVKKILCKCSNAFLVDMFSCYVCSLSFQSFVILKDKFETQHQLHLFEPSHGKTNNPHRRKQRRRSAKR